MTTNVALSRAAALSLLVVPAAGHALTCAKDQTLAYQAGVRDGTADATESYDRNWRQHGNPAAPSAGPDGVCYREAYDASYDRAIKRDGPPAAPAPAAKVRYFSKHVFSPAAGIVCDTYGTAYCADGTGVSMSWTEHYLGPEAVRKFNRMFGDGGFDGSTFVLSNHVQCRIADQACFRQKGGTQKDEAMTRLLFP